jgi:hypothetical protein
MGAGAARTARSLGDALMLSVRWAAAASHAQGHGGGFGRRWRVHVRLLHGTADGHCDYELVRCEYAPPRLPCRERLAARALTVLALADGACR